MTTKNIATKGAVAIVTMAYAVGTTGVAPESGVAHGHGRRESSRPMAGDENSDAAPAEQRDNTSRYSVPDAAAELPKHKLLLRSARDGQILSALMLPAVLLSPPAGYGVITTTGRKTGKRRRKCIRVIRRGDRAYLVQLVPPHVAVTRPGAVSSWVWNIRANPHVRLRIKGGCFAGVAHEITDPAELDVARSVLCESVYPTDYAEAGLHLRGLPTRAKIKGLHRYWFDTGHPLVVELRS
jgi:deazaflavin-dependent oxidoreductase (nitroreductase family)